MSITNNYSGCHFTTKELADEMDSLISSTILSMGGCRSATLQDEYRLRLAKYQAIQRALNAPPPAPAKAAREGETP